MLETPEERVKLLKAGISGKNIEILYIIYNNFKVIGSPLLFEPNTVDTQEKVNRPINSNDRGC